MFKSLSFLKIAFILTLVASGMLLLRQVLTPSVAYTQAAIDPEALTGEYDPSETVGEFYGQQFASSYTESNLAEANSETQVLGESDPALTKRIEVDLTTQRLYAYEGDELKHYFSISSGKWGKTPTGTFTIWTKFRYTKMEGGSKAKRTYYYLPNVPYVMFFANEEVPAWRGFGIHGTYWHDNFGTPMSHGCINMKTEEAGILYNWANPVVEFDKSGKATAENPGTKVIIYGTAPGS